MGVKLLKHKPTSLAKLRESIIRIWHHELSKEYTQPLIRSLLRRYQAVIEARKDQQNIRLYFIMFKHFHVTFLYFWTERILQLKFLLTFSSSNWQRGCTSHFTCYSFSYSRPQFLIYPTVVKMQWWCNFSYYYCSMLQPPENFLLHISATTI